jgi:peroxiredoxin
MKSSITTSLTGKLAPNFCLPSVSGQVRLSDYTGRRNVLLYFMSRFANSLAWRGVISLDAMYDSLQAQDTKALVIGQGGYLGPATRLAAELGLPFLFLSDLGGEVFRRYGLAEIGRRPPPVATVLVDKQNIIRYVYLGVPPGAIIDATCLMNILGRLDFPLPLAPCVELYRSV